MQELKEILAKKKLQNTPPPSPKKSRPINFAWEEAKEFAEYVGLSTPFVLKLCKLYGKARVYGLRSYLKDSQCARSMYAGMVVNKLKERANQA